jgi:hypothetical protein
MSSFYAFINHVRNSKRKKKRKKEHPSSTLVHHILPAYRYIAQDSARCTGEHKAAGQIEWFSNDLDVQVWCTCWIHCFSVESGFKLGRCNDVLLLCMERF